MPMRDMAAGPRVLLKRLRELMAEALEPQERLDRIVHDIAQNMVAEVCSLYVLRADSVLELYATEGLNPGSVHLAQLRLGQGLVGTIAASARAAQPVGRAAASGLRLPAGDRRGDLQLLPRRAGAAGRPHARRAGRAEPHQAPVPRRRGRGAGNDGHGDRRDDRRRRSGAADPAGPGTRPAPAGELHRPLLQRRRRARPRRAARAAHRRHQSLQRGQRRGDAAARDRARLAPAVDRRHAVAPRRRLRGRASRRARSLPHVRQRPRLGAPAGGGGAQRPDRRGGGREGAERHARAHAAHDRSLSARADERFRRPRQPAAAAADGPRARTMSPRRCPRTPSSSPARWARPSCSTIRATSCAAWCWRTAPSPATSSSWRAPWAFPSPAR